MIGAVERSDGRKIGQLRDFAAIQDDLHAGNELAPIATDHVHAASDLCRTW
jgi:hypothetical protein